MRKRDVLYAHSHDIRHNPGEIAACPAAWGWDQGGRGRGGRGQPAAALGELGLDLAMMILPPPHSPAVLGPLAEASTQLRRRPYPKKPDA